ncbi:MAG: RsmE family RNA methyltransferase [Phycisphaerales bacterium]
MTLPWFYYDASMKEGGTIALSHDETVHMRSARRLGPGSPVALFDGRGNVADGEVASISRGSARIHIASVKHHPPPERKVHLISNCPKGDRLAALISMATQLGMSSFTPLICEHSVRIPRNESAARWSRIAIESCKQCHCPHLPTFHDGIQVHELAQRSETNVQLIIAHPGGGFMHNIIRNAGDCMHFAIAIGPEAGFTDEEVSQLLAAGAARVDLGPVLMRIETAAVAAITLAAAALREADD